MKKKQILLAACGVFFLLGLSVLGLSNFDDTRQISVMESEELPAKPQHYILKLSGEYVAVFDSSSPDTPLEITQIHVSSLRHYDREQLKHGIIADTRDELLLLLEDYGS